MRDGDSAPGFMEQEELEGELVGRVPGNRDCLHELLRVFVVTE